MTVVPLCQNINYFIWKIKKIAKIYNFGAPDLGCFIILDKKTYQNPRLENTIVFKIEKHANSNYNSGL